MRVSQRLWGCTPVSTVLVAGSVNSIVAPAKAGAAAL